MTHHIVSSHPPSWHCARACSWILCSSSKWGIPERVISLRTMGGGLARWKNPRRVVAAAVGVTCALRWTFRPGKYIRRFSYGFEVVVRNIWEWKPGSTQNFAARLVSIVVWPGEPFVRKYTNFKKCTTFQIGHVQNLKKSQYFRDNKNPQGASRHKGAFRSQKRKIEASKGPLTRELF